MRAIFVGSGLLKQLSSTTSPINQRTFSTSRISLKSYGFIGLGQMGYQMAKNLRAKIGESDSLTVYDVSAKAMESLQQEAGNVSIAKSAREVAEKAVRCLCL